jgi:tRNA A-37 threonylcarbamoyl transferase component Bud32
VVTALDIRLRDPTPGLLALPWRQRLEEWDVTQVAFRDIPVGPSRHLVRFVEADGRLWALKDLPRRVAVHEYGVLRTCEARDLATVRAAGVVLQTGDSAILVTHYLERSWQYRRLLMRVPWSMTAHRARLFDAMAALLVDLHRSGIYWGDCSLANTLFVRDGQVIQAWMVDAETAEFHPVLSDGQRSHDLAITTENVAGGLLDVAARLDEPPESYADIVGEAEGVAERYEELWQLLHDEPIVALGDQQRIGSRVRTLTDAGFTIDEVRLESAGAGAEGMGVDDVRVKVAVAGRRFHSQRLQALTGIVAGEGQARILVNDVESHSEAMERTLQRHVPVEEAARDWLLGVYTPGVQRAVEVLGGTVDPVQAFCDLLEVRWLLSERAGHDVGDDAALDALASRAAPSDAAATMAFVEMPTAEMPALTPELLDEQARRARTVDDGGEDEHDAVPSPS